MAAVAVACLVAVLRWLMLAGLAGALGGLAGTAGLAVVIFGARALLALPAHPAVAALLATGQGGLVGVECAAFALAAGALRLRQPGLSVPPLLAVVLAEAIRAHPEDVVPVGGALLSVVHVLPAVMWAGMLLYTLRAAIAWREDPVAVRGLVRLYANAAVWLFAVVVLTGVVSALVLVPLGSLLSSGYGIMVIVKAVLVAAVAGAAIAGRAWLGRVPDPARPVAPARATRLECYGLAAVLAATAVLTVLTPPATPARGATARAVHATHAAAGSPGAQARQPGRSADGWPVR